MHYDVVRPSELSPARVARWSELQALNPLLDSGFIAPQWAQAVERAQGPASRVRVAVAVQDGRDVGFLAAKVGAFAAMPAGAPMNDYQALVAEPGVTIDPRRMVRALGVRRMDFDHMVEGPEAFAPYARGRAMSQVVDVAAGYAAYAEGRKAAGVGVLKDCDRKRRRAEREAGPVRFTAFDPDGDALAALMAWKSAQFRATNQTDIFETPWTRRLLADLVRGRTPAFGAGVFTLRFGDRLAAVHVHLLGSRTVHGWMIAHDAAAERHSPGLLLFQSILQWMDETAYSRLDLGPGDYRFKRELANAGQWVNHGVVGLASPALMLRQAAYGVRVAAETLPLGRFSHLPGKAMRRVDRWRALR